MRDFEIHPEIDGPARTLVPGTQGPGSRGSGRARGGARRAVAGAACAGLAVLALATTLGGGIAVREAEAGEARRQQERQATFRADVELVVHDVAVMSPEGEPVSGLTAGDFRVFDDGVAQDIELFLTSEQTPLDVALVLDSSSSIAPVAFTARRAALTFLERLSVDDCVYVVPFNERVGPALWGSPANPRTRRFLQGIQVGGGTALYDAILAALQGVRRDPAPPRSAAESSGTTDEAASGPAAREPASAAPGEAAAAASRGPSCGAPLRAPTVGVPDRARRRALVLVSDGADEDSQATWIDVRAAAEAAGVPVFTVAVGLASQDPHLEARLRELARNTGGRLIEDVDYAALQGAYADIVSLLRGTYLIGYVPGGSLADVDGSAAASGASAGGGSGEGGPEAWHEVRIELRRPLFRALHRPGYYR